MKREIFSRAVRMQHQFGATEKVNDVFDKNTFDLNPPVAVSNLSRPGTTGPREVQQYGESGYRRESSPVQKPGGGFATLDGPTPDPVEPFARPIPVGTKRRLGPPRTDK